MHGANAANVKNLRPQESTRSTDAAAFASRMASSVTAGPLLNPAPFVQGAMPQNRVEIIVSFEDGLKGKINKNNSNMEALISIAK